MARTEPYPPLEPFRTGRLRVSDLHELYWEECGRQGGEPILFIHGGPGAGTTASDRRFFDFQYPPQPPASQSWLLRIRP